MFKIVNESSNSIWFSISGLNGDPGEAGKGGEGAASGKTVKAKCLFLFIGALNIEETEEVGEVVEKAADGIDDLNYRNRTFPIGADPFVNQSYTINGFKQYVREHMAENHLRESDLREFLHDLDEDQRIQLKYDPIGLVDELTGMEKQYFQLRHKLRFIPFVKSLLGRIVRCADQNILSKADKQVLNYLYTATLGKLCSIQNRAKHISTVDLLKYLDRMKRHIKDLNVIEKSDAINENRKQFKNSIDSKIKCATDLIENRIMPELEEIFTEMNGQILKLIDEAIKKQKQNTIDEQKLKELLTKQKILYWLTVIGLGVLCFSAAGVIVGVLSQKFGAFAPAVGKIGICTLICILHAQFEV